MITSKKLFGSYVWEHPCFDVEPAAGLVSPTLVPSSYTHDSCAIPPHWTALELLSVKKYNHDTSIFRFRLPDGKKHLGLPIGAYVLVKAPNCEHGGGDAVRPYTSITDETEANNGTQNFRSSHLPVCDLKKGTGTFDILCKRYDQWGQRETPQTHFLFTKTNHSFRPPGAVSNHIHSLKPGQTLDFKFNSSCIGRTPFPFRGCRRLMLIAVGVGVAPMVAIIRAVLNHKTLRALLQQQQGSEKSLDSFSHSDVADDELCGVDEVVLLYGVRTVNDILLREQLEAWERDHQDSFRTVFCIGSRWANVHWGAKTVTSIAGAAAKDGEGVTMAQYVPPLPPAGFETLRHAEQSWVNAEVIKQHGFPPEQGTHVLVCGLPGVYRKLCGDRNDPLLDPDSALHQLGYTPSMVTKL